MIDGSAQDASEDEQVVHELAGRPLFATEDAARRFAEDSYYDFDIEWLMSMKAKNDWTEAQLAHFRRIRARREGRERRAQAALQASRQLPQAAPQVVHPRKWARS